MKFENTEVLNFEGAIRGMRNPMESWNKSDSDFYNIQDDDVYNAVIGEKDLHLMQNLIRAGTSDSKFMRQIFVCVDITASQVWWSQFDTYKVGTVGNSTSKMHKLASTKITQDRFEVKNYKWSEEKPVIGNIKIEEMREIIYSYIELIRQEYLQSKNKMYWEALIELLPESWLQKRTITMNYENIRNMYFQRRNHKLTEWSVDFVNWVKSLPYAEELIMLEK